jgi:pyruvate kinase
MLNNKKTKIICTIGPASESVELIKQLISAGMDGARLNFSHGSHTVHEEYIKNIRIASKESGKIITIIQDLSGPKLRIGRIEGGEIEIASGSLIRISAEEVIGTANLISTNYPGMIDDVKSGETLLIDDGKLALNVISIDKSIGIIECGVIVGGIMKERKGINLPHTKLSLPSLTDKDLSDINFGIEHKVDLIAMSFVRTREDVELLKNILKEKNSPIPVIAKIERPEAVENIDSIIESTDFVMVARGDMGVEISTEDVPVIQKMIIRKCNEKIKPVITATQMLESMINSPSPTRAEASDIANAILDGTDCVMLSAETSTGSYPVVAVATMNKIIRKTETIQTTTYFKEIFVEDSPENTLHTICNSAVEIATRVNAKAIITITHTGRSPLLLSNHRPYPYIISATYEEEIIKMCKLFWGVVSIVINKSESFYDTLTMIREKLLSLGMMESGDRVVVVSPMPFTDSESANMIQVTQI